MTCVHIMLIPSLALFFCASHAHLAFVSLQLCPLVLKIQVDALFSVYLLFVCSFCRLKVTGCIISSWRQDGLDVAMLVKITCTPQAWQRWCRQLLITLSLGLVIFTSKQFCVKLKLFCDCFSWKNYNKAGVQVMYFPVRSSTVSSSSTVHPLVSKWLTASQSLSWSVTD